MVDNLLRQNPRQGGGSVICLQWAGLGICYNTGWRIGRSGEAAVAEDILLVLVTISSLDHSHELLHHSRPVQHQRRPGPGHDHYLELLHPRPVQYQGRPRPGLDHHLELLAPSLQQLQLLLLLPLLPPQFDHDLELLVRFRQQLLLLLLLLRLLPQQLLLLLHASRP